MRTSVSLESVGALIEGNHANPFAVLGPHEVEYDGRKALAVRAFLPQTKQAWVLDAAHQASRPMRQLHPAGLYEAICPLSAGDEERRYQLRMTNQRGETITMHDPYAFPHLLSD